MTTEKIQVIDAWRSHPLPGDGHTIFKPSFYLAKNYPIEFIDRYTTEHVSGEGKYGITRNDGQPVTTLKGVYNLDVLSAICRMVNGKAEGKFGRGSQAQAYVEAINKALKIKVVE